MKYRGWTGRWPTLTAGREMRDFVSKLIAVRQEHTALRSRHFLHGQREPAPGIFDIAWFNEDGENIPEASWNNPEHRLLCLRRATRNADQQRLAADASPQSHRREASIPITAASSASLRPHRYGAT